ncbi:MAG: Gfo/Idh/MocA family oxidoreductase [Verrucomicrobiales bacterium]
MRCGQRREIPQSGRPGQGHRRHPQKFPNARFYEDWREMLEAEKGKVDAVTVSTPDHVHAFASIAAMRASMSVYCQKPLTHGIWEARAMTKVASQTGVVTQMGNQAHAGQHMRRMVELVRSGIIGDVTEVHCWTNRPIWPQGMAAFPAGEEAPKHINWDLWLGPAPQHDYNEKIMPFNWRGYWDFGTGALGDMACHVMDMAYWSLELGSPTSVSAEHGGATEVSPPVWATITYEFPARDKRPPVKFVWYDGNMDAVFDEKTWKLVSKDNPNSPPKQPNQPPKDITEGQPIDEGKGYGTIMIGSRGKLWMPARQGQLDGQTFLHPRRGEVCRAVHPAGPGTQSPQRVLRRRQGGRSQDGAERHPPVRTFHRNGSARQSRDSRRQKDRVGCRQSEMCERSRSGSVHQTAVPCRLGSQGRSLSG